MPTPRQDDVQRHRGWLLLGFATALAGCTGGIGEPGLGAKTPAELTDAGAAIGGRGGRGGASGTGGASGGTAQGPQNETGVPLVRLTNAQYDNFVADTLGVDGRPAKAFPAIAANDTKADSYPLVKAYFEGADAVAARAFGPGGKFEKGCAEASVPDVACASDFIVKQARLLYRRALAPGDIDALVTVFKESQALGQREALRRTLATMLLSPSFLYRVELGKGGALGDEEVAARLALAAWNSAPTPELLDLAARGELRTGAQRAAQLQTMLRSDKARRMVGDLAAGWLHSRGVADVTKDVKGFDADVAAAMAAETERFVTEIFFQGEGGFKELFTADYSFVNEKLKTIYGMTGVTGSALARATLPAAQQRSGVLTQPSVLTVNSTAAEASPIMRGVFVWEGLLCQERPRVPDGVPPLPAPEKDGKKLTQRQRLEAHRSQPQCAACHATFDGFGLALEKFDLVGRYVDNENGTPLTADGKAADVDGKPRAFQGPRELGTILAGSETARRCFVQRVVETAAGHDLTGSQRALVDALSPALAAKGDLQQVLVGLVAHESFVNRTLGGK